jgi:hypothetical protein
MEEEMQTLLISQLYNKFSFLFLKQSGQVG